MRRQTDDPASGIRSRILADPGSARLLRAFARSTGLTVALEEVCPAPGRHGPACERMSSLGGAGDPACVARRAGLLGRVATAETSAATRCPVGAFCLAAPVFSRGLQVATLRAGGFTKKMGASKGRANAVRELLVLAADELGRLAADLLAQVSPRGSPVNRAMSYIHARYQEPLRLKDVASHSGRSPQHLARLWKKHVGISPHAYLTAVRIDRAKALLESGQRKVIEIALECGFGSLSQFNRAFLKATGVAPRRWHAK